MEFTRCPYDASPIEIDPNPGGLTLLTCATCGAAWEWYKTWLRRIREPNRDSVKAARAVDAPVPVIRSAPNPELANAMWRQVRTSITSIARDPNRSPQ